jgi:hypothetical protein
LFDSLVDDLYSEQVVQLYDDIKNKDLKIGDKNLDYALLHRLTQTYDRKAARALVKYDAGKGKISPFWINVLKQVGGIKK